jgi:tetratricopeptide (TPR) repeat protein
MLKGLVVPASLRKNSLPLYAQGSKVTILSKAYVLLASLKRALGKEAEAWRHCREGRDLFPDDLELLFEEGLQCRNRKEPAAAQWCFERILELPPQPCFVAVDQGLRSHLCREQLALAHRVQGHLAEAETQWRAALQQCPTFVAAWLGLAEVCLEMKHLGDVETLIEQARQIPDSVSIISAIKANVAQWRGDHLAAKQLLSVGISQDPRSLWLRLMLVAILMRENGQMREAEKLVREVLAISPNHNRAKRFLQEIEAKMSRPALAVGT